MVDMFSVFSVFRLYAFAGLKSVAELVGLVIHQHSPACSRWHSAHTCACRREPADPARDCGETAVVVLVVTTGGRHPS